MLISTRKNLELKEVKLYLPVSMASDIESIIPFANAAEAEHIEPLLGSALYAHLLAYYANPAVTGTWIGSNHTKWGELLVKVQRAIINLAYWSGFDLLNVEMDSTGFHRAESENRKTVFKYQEENLKNGFRNNGFNGLDQVMEYLESNISVFADYESSSYYTVRRASIIPDTKTFNAIYFIDNSRLIFLRLQRYIDQIEDFQIQSVLGSTLYQKIKTEIVKSTPAEEITALLPYLRKPIVYLAIAKTLTELGVNITDRAVFLRSQESNMVNSDVHKPVPDPTLMQMIRSAQQAGDLYISQLTSFLCSLPDKYPEYSGQTGSIYKRDNTDKKTFWA